MLPTTTIQDETDDPNDNGGRNIGKSAINGKSDSSLYGNGLHDNYGTAWADAATQAEDATILKSSILVVDDQAAHVHLLERLLHDTGYTNVSSTLDPGQVGALHREHAYDLILLDLQMPGLDGFGVMEDLRAATGHSCLPVIVLTAQPAHKMRALQAGARDFINKPFEAVEVQVRIHHMLQVRLLQKQLEAHNRDLERTVRERTAQLQESETRYRNLTELAVDWFWEQDESGKFTIMSGPVMELLSATEADVAQADVITRGDTESRDGVGAEDNGEDIALNDAHYRIGNWDVAQRKTLQEKITSRRPFLDFIVHCLCPDGSRREFKISGQPIFDGHCRFIGYRGLGVEVRAYA